jgi:ABC-type Fe3+ transport system substrate-binding protein
MVGGAYYKGYKLTVNAAIGDYILDMTMTDKSCALNGITVVPDKYGAGDYFKLEHLNSANVVQALLSDTVYNVGAQAAWLFDFPAMELMDAGDKLRLTYTNVAGIALNVYTNLERLTTKDGGL